jgi:uncharacterized RDD family membrane protein YckC
MKCPKCGYLGFETSERCRNCGYDFSLAVDVSPASELPLHVSNDAGAPLADFDLTEHDTTHPQDNGAGLGLDRLIGAADTPPPSSRRPTRSSPDALPLFNSEDDVPLITTPRPARPPLSVRRTTPEIPRVRSRAVTPRPEEGELAFQPDPATEPVTSAVATPRATVSTASPANAVARLLASVIDLALLAAINAAVIYLTLALAGLTVNDVAELPVIPMVTFFAILDGGYLVTFIAASGQTIGKMITGVRVLADNGQRVDIRGAILRAAGCGISLLTAGLGYLPAFVTADGRALQDRLSGTRVVSAR